MIPLVRNITVFVLQYAVAVVTAMKLQAAWEVAMAGQAVSGACAGYFLRLDHRAAAPLSNTPRRAGVVLAVMPGCA